MPLKEPLTRAHIEAADRVRNSLSQWRLADSSLRALRDAFPEFSPEACLLKVVALNSLYGTNVYAVLRMAEHIGKIMSDPGRPAETIALVERISNLEPQPGQRKRAFTSFASKFIHFFENEEAPIYDSYAQGMLKIHLGIWKGAADAMRPYASFVHGLDLLRAEGGIEVGVTELDHYLWLAGQCRAWRTTRDDPSKDRTYRELAGLLSNPPPDLAGDLEILMGTGGHRRDLPAER